MENTEILYRYCRKNNLLFAYAESEFFINITFSTIRHKQFNYVYDKEAKRINRITFNCKDYEDFEQALSDFDDMLLLDKQIYMNF